MGHGSRHWSWLLCLVWLPGGCGQTTQDGGQRGAAEQPPFGATLSTNCKVSGSDWLELEEHLPGRWASGSLYMEVEADLHASWGTSLESADLVEGTSDWARDADGLVEEVGLGPCSGGAECGARFVSRGTAAVGDRELVFYALWPLDPCQHGIVGRYEGRERFENNRSTAGELRLWSERSEQLTLEADGTWLWSIELTTYASVNDAGTVYWFPEPRTEKGRDQGTYREIDGAVTFARQEPAPALAWISAEVGHPTQLELVGRAIRKPGVSRYQRQPR